MVKPFSCPQKYLLPATRPRPATGRESPPHPRPADIRELADTREPATTKPFSSGCSSRSGGGGSAATQQQECSSGAKWQQVRSRHSANNSVFSPIEVSGEVGGGELGRLLSVGWELEALLETMVVVAPVAPRDGVRWSSQTPGGGGLVVGLVA